MSPAAHLCHHPMPMHFNVTFGGTHSTLPVRRAEKVIHPHPFLWPGWSKPFSQQVKWAKQGIPDIGRWGAVGLTALGEELIAPR